ncbi:ribonuclease H-like domain-containing protein [Tanacetum coccineum]
MWMILYSSPVLLQQIIDSLHKEFDMTDLGALNYFLGIFDVRHSTGLFLSQKKYALQLLERAHMVHCNPSRMPVDTETKLGPDVQQICLYMHDPREPHFAALKHVPRYVKGTLDPGLHLYASATTSLIGYTDADWAGCPSTRRSTSVDHVRVLHVPSSFRYVDIFTKGLPSTLFEDFTSSLSVRPPPTQTVGISYRFYLGLKPFLCILYILWVEAMNKEMEALNRNNTWVISDLPKGRRPIGCKWIFKVKYKSNGKVERFKARLVAKGFNQKEGIDYEETFSPVIKMVTVSKNYHYLFIKSEGQNTIVLLVYVDDIIITGNNIDEIVKFKTLLSSKFVIKDLGKGSLGKGVFYKKDNTFELTAFVDSDWAKCTSTTKSSAEAEYREMSNVACEIIGVLKLLTDLKVDYTISVKMFCDSKATEQIAANPVFHERTKHFEIDLYFLGEKIAKGIFETCKIQSEFNTSDVLTKGLSSADHKRMCDLLKLVDVFQIYYMSFVKVPESTLSDIERLRAKFFWGGEPDSKLLIWIKWETVLASLIKGGLGIRSLKAFNLALLQKWRWNSLWAQVIKAIHGEEAGSDQNRCNSNGVWSKIVGSINQLHSNGIVTKHALHYKLGCGTKVWFWKDYWSGDTPIGSML